MHGRPITEWIVFLVCWLALLVPVVRLTGRVPDAGPPAPVEAAGDTAIRTDARLQASSVPRMVRVRQGDRVLWELKQPDDTPRTASLALTVEDHVAEVWVEASWPESAPRPRVLELLLAPDGMREQGRHLWTDEEVDDVLVYEWSE